MNISRAAYRHVVGLTRERGARLSLALLALLTNGLVEGAGILLLFRSLLRSASMSSKDSVGQLSSRVSATFSALGVGLTLPVVLALFVAVSIVIATLRRTCWILSNSLQHDVARDRAGRLYDAIVRMEWSSFIRMRASDLTVALTAECDQIGQASALMLNIIGSFVVVAVYLGVAARLSPLMTTIVVGCAAVLVLLLRRRTTRSAGLGAAFSSALRRYQAAVTDDLGGMKAIRSYGAEARSLHGITCAAQALADANAANNRHYATATMWLDIGSAATLSGLLLFAISVMHFDAAAILMLLFLFARVVPRVSALQQRVEFYANLLPAVERVEVLEAQCRAAAAPRHDAHEPVPFQRQLRFEAVSFRYSPQDPRVLNGVDFSVDAGTTVAIVGTSGAGKTTIADLMIGLLAPEGGRITIDGTVLADNAASWRETIAYVPQDTFLFHDTIRANLTWVRPDASGEDINRALTLAMADFVHALPNGLDTVVGDRGVRLSGGERQRIALARALLRKPSLLILDEATSAIDRENEQRILEAIDRLHGSVTIVMITHRMAAIAGADAVHVLDAGRIVECSVPA